MFYRRNRWTNILYQASIYHNTKGEWQGNDRFTLKSSDVGDIEFRKENGVWKAAPESLIRNNED